MRCFGFTKKLERCKKMGNPFFCHHHRLQPFLSIFSLVIAIGGLGGAYNDVFFPLYKKISDIVQNENDGENVANRSQNKVTVQTVAKYQVDAERVIRDLSKHIRSTSNAKAVIVAVKNIKTGEIIAAKKTESTIDNLFSTSENRPSALNYVIEPGALIAPFIIAESLDSNSNIRLEDPIKNYNVSVSIGPTYELRDAVNISKVPNIDDYLKGNSRIGGYFLLEEIDFEKLIDHLNSIGLFYLTPKTWTIERRASFSLGYGVQVSVLTLLNGFSELMVNNPNSSFSKETRVAINNSLIKENYSLFDSTIKYSQFIVSGLLTERPTYDARAYNESKKQYVTVAAYPARDPSYILICLVDGPEKQPAKNINDWSTYGVNRAIETIQESHW